MAQAAVGSSMSDHAESSTAAVFSRNDDQMTVALRSEGSIDLDDIIRLNQTAQSSHDIPSSIGTLTTTVFSSRKQSSGTKPTSVGTSYPIHGSNAKGKGVATYASSLSATNGSGSEAEAEQHAALVGIGDWTGDSPTAARPLRGGPVRARKRMRANRPIRHKKPPVVIIQHNSLDHASRDDEHSVAKPASRRSSKEYFRRRPLKSESVKSEQDQFGEAEEGRITHVVEAHRAARKPVSSVRYYVLIGLIFLIGLTFALSVFAAHYTGKGRLACTKGIIFSATVLISCFTVLAMGVARWALQEALLAGLLEFLIGFALVVEIHDFMWHA